LGLLLVPRPPGDDSPEAGFARDMINHHAQAVQMAETVRNRTESEEIRILATDTVLTQQAEIGQMQGWLAVWRLPVSGTQPAMNWMGHPTEDRMPGMAAPRELARLQSASPEEVDEQFLRLMIPHHQAALTMAEAALERSDRPEVRRLAQKIAISQHAEIRGMQSLLERKGLARAEDLDPPLEPEEHGFGHAHLAGVFQEMVRLAPLPLAALAAAWLGIDATRRRRARAGFDEPTASPFFWRVAAVGGLVVSAVLHIGLAPAHFEEATIHGVFFSVASVATAVVAAAILAWPSRPAYLAGIGISLALILLWALFKFAPPPASATVEDVDAVGLLTKAAEVTTTFSCAVLWSRARRPKQGGAEVSGTVEEGRA
jgi:uncharacterized protein (DUF305 family)